MKRLLFAAATAALVLGATSAATAGPAPTRVLGLATPAADVQLASHGRFYRGPVYRAPVYRAPPRHYHYRYHPAPVYRHPAYYHHPRGYVYPPNYYRQRGGVQLYFGF